MKEHKIELKIDRTTTFTLLCIYFSSKMLWDTLIPHAFELLSLGILTIAAVYEIVHARKKSALVTLIFYIIFILYIIACACIKDNSDQISRAIYEYGFYMLMIFSGIYYYTNIEFRRVAKSMVRFGCLIAFLSWYEYFTRAYIIGSFTQTIQNNYGFRAAVFTRTYLSHGVILGVFAILAYYMFISTEKKRYIFISIFCYVSILTTSSRGPLVACTVGLIVMWFVNYYSNHRGIQKRFYIILALLIILLVALLLLQSSFTTGNPTIDYFLWRTRNIINWTGDAGNVGRVQLWNNALNKWFKKAPWFGIGPSKTGSWGSGSLGVTESGVLKRLCELGVVGVAIYYSMLIYIISKGISNFRQATSERKSIYLCLFGIISMILINDITVQTTEQIEVSFLLNVALGGLLIGSSIRS